MVNPVASMRGVGVSTVWPTLVPVTVLAIAAAFPPAAPRPGGPLPVVALMIAGGLVAGWIVVRTGSLAIPIALHVAVDIPLYYGNACL
jgi:membrane protease YdiL (CAAX protease family)